MKTRLTIIAIFGVLLANSAIADSASRDFRFITTLGAQPSRDAADDAKLLVGWATDAASIVTPPAVGAMIDSRSTFTNVSSMSPPTPMAGLRETYRVLSSPLVGDGYWGLPVEMIDPTGRVLAVLLLNRLFRLPVIFHDPVGVATDILTVGALLSGSENGSLRAAAVAAAEAYRLASVKGVPLIVCGQSMSGAIAQYQVAKLSRTSGPPVGFLTFNAANANVSVRRLGIDPPSLSGINFVKDRDPGFGPHSLLTNHTGLQIYIHGDGTGSLEPGGMPVVSAIFHPTQHLLASFQDVDLAAAMIEAGILTTESLP